MNLIDEEIEEQISKEIIASFIDGNYENGVKNIRGVLDCILAKIPEKKRISYGRYTTIKVMAEKLFNELRAANLSAVKIGARILDATQDYQTMGVGLGILALYGLGDYQSILPYFESAAKADHWEPREYAQGLFRKVVKANRADIRVHLLAYVQDDDPNLRRFVSEMLRPVVENQWIYEDMDYSLSILRYLFQEPEAYPRTSVGNNLSDIARRNPELVFQLVNELVSMDDKNAYWIATRACRNLVKQDPIRVMDTLGVDEYKYKKQVYKRSDYL